MIPALENGPAVLPRADCRPPRTRIRTTPKWTPRMAANRNAEGYRAWPDAKNSTGNTIVPGGARQCPVAASRVRLHISDARHAAHGFSARIVGD